MRYYTISPPEKLAPFVRTFWVYEGEATESQPYIYRGYADACAELIFHYKSDFDLLRDDGSLESSITTGLHAQGRNVTRWSVSKDWAIFGCYLYPYAIPALFGYPAADLTNSLVDLRSLLGVEGAELEERMMTAASNDRRVSILSVFLERRLDLYEARSLPIFRSIGSIIEARGLVDIRELSDSLGLSHRHFERKFKEFAGFSPKTYTRIARFQGAVKEFGSGKSLTDIAYECGYYDQSHFIADFREFSGYSPGTFFRGSAEGSEYLDA